MKTSALLRYALRESSDSRERMLRTLVVHYAAGYEERKMIVQERMGRVNRWDVYRFPIMTAIKIYTRAERRCSKD